MATLRGKTEMESKCPSCSIDELQNKPVLVRDVFNISKVHISRTIEDAAWHVLKTKMKSNLKGGTIEFKSGGRVSLGLLIRYTTLSNSHLFVINWIFGFNFLIKLF